jgi:hypothetical protein
MIDFHLDERDLHRVLFHEGAVSEAEAMQRLWGLVRKTLGAWSRT